MNFDRHIALIRRKYSHSISKLLKMKNKYRRNSLAHDIKELYEDNDEVAHNNSHNNLKK